MRLVRRKEPMSEQIRMPKHIAFIMDGNGRWAKKRLLPRKAGHKQGVEAMRRVVDWCDAHAIECVTFYAFSTENWQRPQEEIDALFELIDKFADREMQNYVSRGFRIRILGDLTQLPPHTREVLAKIIEQARTNTGLCVNIAINYGARQEIVQAVNRILRSGLREIDAQMLSDCLYTGGQPDPDVIVRTGGEKRLSNFLLWQSAYSELVYLDTYWPDMDDAAMERIVADYSSRDRRYGKIKRGE